MGSTQLLFIIVPLLSPVTFRYLAPDGDLRIQKASVIISANAGANLRWVSMGHAAQLLN
jgi:hypothetical protein